MTRRITPIESNFMSRFGDKFTYFDHLMFGIDHVELKAIKRGDMATNDGWGFVMFSFPLTHEGEQVNWDSYTVRPFDVATDW